MKKKTSKSESIYGQLDELWAAKKEIEVLEMQLREKRAAYQRMSHNYLGIAQGDVLTPEALVNVILKVTRK